MREFSVELKVGAFALLVIIIVAFMTFKTGGLGLVKRKGYTMYAYFNNVAGLDKETRIKVAGVDAGFIEDISLSNGRAKVKLRIYPDVKIYRNTVASIRSSGLLGDKFLDINVGSSDYPELKEGDTIENVVEFVDIDDLARNLLKLSRNFTKLTESLNEVFGTDEAKSSLKYTVVNLREITTNLNETITVNDQKIRTVLDNINNLTASLNRLIEDNRESLTNTITNISEFSDTIKTSGPALVENLKSTSEELKSIIEENRPAITSTLESLDNITKKIDKGEGSLGKLVQDESLYDSLTKAAENVKTTLSAVERFRTFITFQAEYLSEPEDGKGYFYLTLKPKPDKYYILGVVGDPLGKVTTVETTTTPPGTVVKEEELERRIEFTAQFAKRFGNAALRLGLTENTFGAGGDYFFNDDKGRITADIWDFSNDEEDAKNPHLKIGLDYFLFKNLFVSAGADNILNERWFGGYIGMGLRFEDEDIKYLLGTVPTISTR